MAERYEDRYRYGRNRRDRDYSDDRGYMDRAGDEIRSWFGDEEAERRRRMDEERDRLREREGDWRRSSGEGRTSESRWRGMGEYDEGRGYSAGGPRGDRDWDERRRWSGSAGRDREQSWSERDRSSRDVAPRSESVWSTDDGRTQFGRGISGSSYGRGREAGSSDYGSSYGARDYGDRDFGDRDAGARGYRDSSRDYGSRDYGSQDYGSRDYGARNYGRTDYSGDYGRSAYGTREYGAREYGSRDYAGTDYSGRGPKGYQRSDSRIYEDVCDRLSRADVDASNIEVSVKSGEVTLSGTVRNRADKRRAEDLAEEVSGVREVHNSVRVDRDNSGIGYSETSTSNQPGSMLGVSPNPNPTPGSTTPSGTKRSSS